MKLVRIAAAAVALLSPVAVLAAPITLTNPGFETGTLSGWSTIGSVAPTASTTVTTFNSVIWTVNAAGTTMAQLWSNGSSITGIETTLGIASGTLQALNPPPAGGALTNGSALYQSFIGLAGDTVSMAWNYVATDYVPFNDPAYALLIGPANSIEVLATIYGDGVAVGTAGNSGWQNFTGTLGASGNYTLAFVTTNDKDQVLDSVLHIDNVAGTCVPNCPPIGAVPEPGSLVLAGLGLSALALLRRRRKV